jgi:transposase
LAQEFSRWSDSRVALETGTHSPWVSRLLEEVVERVYVANARKVRLIHQNPHKNDRLDARVLARLVRFDPELLEPVRHRSEGAQADMAVLQARDRLVRARSAMVNTVRSLLKSSGLRAPSCSTESFAKRVQAAIPDLLRPALGPLVETIAELTRQIRAYDAQIEAVCERYPVTERFQAISGVGPVTALAYTLVIEDPHRFRKSRQVGSYVGLTPRRDQSGQSDPQLRITKAGHGFLRQLLVSAAHYILGPFGPDCALRRWGLAKAGTGDNRAKKKAVVAVARKLAVLMHAMWITGQCYDPLEENAVAGERSA